jgi:signal transduction histidine kinase
MSNPRSRLDAVPEASCTRPDATEAGRLREELTRFRRRLDSLTSVGMAMGCLQSLDDLYNFFVEVIAAEFEAERVSLMRYDGSTATLQIVAAHGLDPEVVRTTRVRLGEGVAGRVVADGKPMVVTDTAMDPRLGHPPRPDLGGSFVSMPLTLSVPLVAPHEILGVINVTNRCNGAAFDDDDTAFISALAGQVVAVVERAVSLERLRQSHASLQEVQSDLAASSKAASLGEIAGGLASEMKRISGRILECVGRIEGVLKGTTAAESVVRDSTEVIRELVVRGSELAQKTQAIALGAGDEIQAETSLQDAARLGARLVEAEWRERAGPGDQHRIEWGLASAGLVRGNRHEIARAVTHLIRNAAEATPGGGIVQVSIDNRSGFVLLSVSDSGTGIPSSHRHRLFEPFFTTRAGHQGLGLSIVHGLAQRMGASVDVSSEEGAGTTVTISFPEAGNDVTLPRAELVGSAAKAAGATILLVDPSLHRLGLYGRFLKRDGASDHQRLIG